MHCVIPAAGNGTRLRPLTWSKPKPLVSVAGSPMLAHIIESLKQADVDHITLITGYRGQDILEWTRAEYPDIRVDGVFQEEADGLASAVLLARKTVEDGPLLVVLSDTLFDADLSLLKNETRNMIAASYVEDPSRFGVVVLENGSVVRLVEKPSEPISNMAIVGVYYFSSGDKLMNYCSLLKEKKMKTRGEYQLTDAMQLMLQDGEPFGMLGISGWYDCGKPETLLESNRILLEKKGDRGTPRLENSTVISPCSFGEGTVIRNSVIGPWFSGGDGVSIENSRVSNTVVGAGTVLRDVVLTDTITGDRVKVEGSPARLNLGDDSVSGC